MTSPPIRAGRPRVRTARALVLAGALAALGAVGTAAPASAAMLLTTTFNANERGVSIPRSFLGISTDWNYVLARTGTPATGPNPIYGRLMRQLASFGGGVPTLRVGGNYQDSASWQPSGAYSPSDVRRGLFVPLGPETMQGLAANARLLGQRMILGINLAINDPAIAQAEVRAILQYIPRKYIRFFNIGNEPDFYAYRVKWEDHANGGSILHFSRAPGYNARQYLREFEATAGAIHAIDPSLPLAGTDGYSSVVSDEQFLAREQRRIVAYTTHAYEMAACDLHGRRYLPGEKLYPTVSRLLGPTGTTSLPQEQRAASVARKYHKPIYVDEMNSTACDVSPLLGDSFGAGLWALDHFFIDVFLGMRSDDLHSDNNYETPFAITDYPFGHWFATITPLYYAMLAFAEATGRQGRLLMYPYFAAIKGDHGRANASVWTVRAPDRSLRFVVINKDERRSGLVRITVPHARGAGKLVRLVAPGVNSLSGFTYAGQAFANPTTTGRLEGRRRTATVRPVHGTYSFFVRRGSVTTLFAPAPGR